MKAVVLTVLAGCSFIYNPSNVESDKTDAQQIFDADPSMLAVLSSDTPTIYEAEGDGSRQAVLVIRGHNFVPDLSVTIATTTANPPTVTIDPSQLGVSADHEMLAIPVKVPQSDALTASDAVHYDVTVSQRGFSQTLTDAFVVQGLPELRGTGTTALPANPPTYSLVDLESMSVSGTAKIALHAIGSIKISGAISLDSTGQAGGPGGSSGGAGATGGGGDSGAGMGPAHASGNGIGATWVGDDQLSTFGTGNDQSSGGSGGGTGALGAGGPGGGGGGLLELGAGGDLSIGTITAKGGNGAKSNLNMNPGGGGSGGAVILRSGGSITAAVDISGGTGNTAGGPGRVRADAPTSITGVALTPSASPFRGPTFATDTPMIVTSTDVKLNVTAQPQHSIQYYINNFDGSKSFGPQTVLVPSNGVLALQPGENLFTGRNELCVIVEGAQPTATDAGQCISIAYLYTP
ncbi:MAG: hypothetical protein QM831_30250 [Kofleriaceae bacterium]